MSTRASHNVGGVRFGTAFAHPLAITLAVAITGLHPYKLNAQPSTGTPNYVAMPVAFAAPSPDAFEARAKENALGALNQVLGECDQQLSDYSCIFIKQERMKGKIGPPQVIRVKCREEPFSVLMVWLRNPDRCERLLYVKGKWKSKTGGEEAWVDPSGTIPDILLGARGTIRYDIHKAVAEGKTRRPVDQFGFVNMLRLIVRVSEIAAQRSELQLAYLGRSKLRDRPTYLFKRLLPYTGKKGRYPDRLLLLHLDSELRVPIGIFTYTDDQRKALLASYVMTNVTLNPGLPNTAFSKEANNF